MPIQVKICCLHQAPFVKFAKEEALRYLIIPQGHRYLVSVLSLYTLIEKELSFHGHSQFNFINNCCVMKTGCPLLWAGQAADASMRVPIPLGESEMGKGVNVPGGIICRPASDGDG